MRVFVTGANGFVGSAIVRELIEAGHQVLGLARSDAAAAQVAAAGAQVHRGSLEDPESLHNGALASGGVIHTAFIHDFANFVKAAETDLHAIETIGTALKDSGKPFVITSGILMLTFFLPPGHLGTEKDIADPGSTMPRVASENATLALAERGVRTSIVRLPPSVHGEGDQGFVPLLINAARAKGISAYPGEGANRWPSVHRLDAAYLFRLALEKAPAGSVLHAVADEGIPVREIAGVIGHRLDVPVTSLPVEEASEHFGFVGQPFSMDAPASSALTRQLLGWHPTQPSLLEDLEQGHYFKNKQ